MKKFKTTLMTLIVSLCLVFGLAFAVACGDKPEGGGGSNNGQTQTDDNSVSYYKVTLSYDDTKGTVTKSDAAAADGYVKDETVTVTVTPKSGYVVDSVKAGNATLAPGADGKYSFGIVGDITVTVTFKDAEEEPSGTALVLDAKYFGTYHDMAETNKSADLVVSATGVKWGDKDVFLAKPLEEGETSYTVTVDGDTYYLSVHDNGVIDLLDATSAGTSFLKDGVTLEFSVTVNVNDSTHGTATLDPVKEKYELNDEVTLTVTPAANCTVEFITLNGEVISLDEENHYTFNVTTDVTINVSFLAEGEIPTEFRGTWVNLADSTDSFTLTATGLTWDGHEVTVTSIAAYVDYFDPTPLGTQITVTIDGDSDNLITLYYGATAVEVRWMDADDGYQDNYYGKGDGKLDTGLLAAGDFSAVGSDATLSVSDDGTVSLGDTVVKVYYTGTDYYFYTDALYMLSIVNANQVTVMNNSTRDSVSYVRDSASVTAHALLVGEWTEMGGGTLVVSADGTMTLTDVDGVTAMKLVYSDIKGSTVLLTTASGTTVDSISLFLSEGEWSFSFYLDDGMVSFSKAGEKVVLDEAWQSGYEYDGTESVDVERFIVTEQGIALLNEFNMPIQSSYVYGVKVSDTEYAIYLNAFYTLILNDDNSITLSDGETAYTYTQCEIEPLDAFNVTLDYDSDQGYAYIDGSEPDGNVYTFAKGDTTLTLYVTAKDGYDIESVKVGDTELESDGAGNYTYETDGSTDITVVVTFAAKQLEQLVIEDATLHGTTWSCSDAPYADTKLTIDAEGRVKLGDNDVLYVDDSYNGYLVMIDGVQWTLITTQVSENKLELMSTDVSGDVTPDYIFTKDGGSTAPTTYSVTITYGDGSDQTMGTVVADKDSYSAGETVTLTITPAAGYTLGSVTVNGETESPTLNADGSYTLTFEIHSDTPVVVTFTASTAD